jgi:carbon storage regulator CsrA
MKNGSMKMLVLTRRPNEKIVFPTIRTEVQVLGMHGGQVRLGIQAPPQVSVIREELRDRTNPREGGDCEPARRQIRTEESMREICHHIRNRLNDIGLTLGVMRCRLQRGETGAASESLNKLEEDFRILKEELEKSFADTGLEHLEEADHPVGTHSK